MANANVHEFSDDNFKAEVLESDKPVLVDFWAEWCMPCRMLAPTIDELAQDFGDRAKIGKMDVDSHKDTAMQFGVSSIPTVILFKNGEAVKRFVGITKKDDLAAAITEAAG